MFRNVKYVPYEGELLPEYLFEEFAKLFHCPTAVYAKHLNYTAEGKTVKVILLGNPTCIGPNLNSTDRVSAAQLIAHQYLHVPFAGREIHLVPKPGATEKMQIDDSSVYFSLSGEIMSDARSRNAELVTNYQTNPGSTEFFKPHHDADAYCDDCFKLSYSDSDPIIMCSTQHCTEGRHFSCFKRNQGPQSLKDITNFHHTCRSHEVEAPAAAAAFTPCHNLPPPFTIDNGMKLNQVIHEKEEGGLFYNSGALEVVVQKSNIDHAGLGLFTTTARAKDETIGFFFGALISSEAYKEMIQQDQLGVIPEDPARHEFTTEAKRGVVRCLDVQDCLSDERDTFKMLVSKQCPMGYMNDPVARNKQGIVKKVDKKKKKKVPEANVRVVLPSHMVVDAAGIAPWDAVTVTTLRPIEAGEELFFDYGWTNSAWKQVARCHALPPFSVASSPSASRASKPAIISPSAAMSSTKSTPDTAVWLKLKEERKALLARLKAREQAKVAAQSVLNDAGPSSRGPPAISRVTTLSQLFVDNRPSECVLPVYPPLLDPPLLVSRFASQDNISQASEDELLRASLEMILESRAPDCFPPDLYSDVPDASENGTSESDSEESFRPLESESESDPDEDDDDEGSSDGVDDDGDYNCEQQDRTRFSPVKLRKKCNLSSNRRVAVAKPSAETPQSTDAALPVEQTSHTRTIIGTVRTPSAAADMIHYALPNWTQDQMTKFGVVAVEYMNSNKDKFSGMAKEALLNDSSKDRVIRFQNLRTDWAEIQACCGRKAGVPVDHAFKDVVQLLRRRVEIHGQFGRSDDATKKQHLLHYIQNMSFDPQVPKSPVVFDGQRCCLSCFRAAMGTGRSTLYRVRSQISNGDYVSTDVRKKQYKISGLGAKCHAVVTVLQKMAEEADNMPTKEGGSNCEFYAFPFSTRECLYQSVQSQLTFTVSRTTYRTAIDYLQRQHRMIISVRKQKKFMQCSSCAKLNNRREAAKGDAAARSAAVRAKQNHINQVNVQRQDYHNLRDRAM